MEVISAGSDQDRLASLLDSARARVTALLDSPTLAAIAADAFGAPAERLAEAIRGLERDGWPALALSSDPVFNGARAAYVGSQDSILVSSSFLASASDEAALAVLVEEIGHALDARINAADAAGDEGAIFAAHVTGKAPDSAALAQLKAENDHASIRIDGQALAVELAAPMAGTVTLDGSLADWTDAQRIDTQQSIDGYDLYGKVSGDSLVFAIRSPGAIGANTTVWLNTDQNAATGYLIWGSAGGAEFNVNFDAAGVPHLYTGGAGETLVAGVTVPYGYSADGTVVEFAVPLDALGSPVAIDTLWDVNDGVFLPTNYWSAQYEILNSSALPARTDASSTVGIVYSETSAKAYFSETAYSQLFMAAQHQAQMAGVRYVVLTEADLMDLSRLANLDALVFPSFANVRADQVEAIERTLHLAIENYDIGIIAAGELMTRDANNAALAGDPYERMKSLLNLNIVGGGFPVDVTFNVTDNAHRMLQGYGDGELIRTYANAGWLAFAPMTPEGTEVLATQTVGGATHAAITATQTGGRNVHFSTEALLGDNNLLWQAIDYSVNGSGVSAGLQMSRNASIVASRVDMDQAMESYDVSPESGAGIYDRLLPVLEQWKSAYNFVGSYYVDIGDKPREDQYTDWARSGEYYRRMLAMGNELGSHSLSHPHDTNTLTAAQIQYEFQGSKQILEQQMSQLLGQPFTVEGAAVPGAPENLQTALSIIQYYDYLSGGYSSIGAGYPGAFGYLTPDMAAQDKVYLAPNMMFDFSLVEFKGMTPDEAAAEWRREWTELTAHGDVPVVLWPWHDYGAATWSVDPPNPSPYTTAMFTSFIADAHGAGAEFVTLADLADRISAFSDSTVTTSVSGNVVTATVHSSDAGRFALDLDHLGAGQQIASVNGWYAYDADSVFLPRNGGTFDITVGATPADVTHIVSLPMRADLLSLSGNGTDLAFSLIGEGRVMVDLVDPAGRQAYVTGASVVSMQGDKLTLDVGAIGLHDVSVRLVAPNHAPVITSGGGADTATVSVAENTTAVTRVTASDADAGQALTYAIAGGADQARFAIAADGTLRFLAAPDFEAPQDADRNNTYIVQVRVSDNGLPSLSDLQMLTVRVTDVFENKAPVITSNGGGDAATISVAENGTAVTRVTAVDGDAGQTLSYAIAGGADAARFVINASTGELAFAAAPDYENPGDLDGNNVYNLLVSARDSGGALDTQALSVAIGNVAGSSYTGRNTPDTYNGGGEEDTISGMAGKDTLYGMGGNDVINGGAADDLIVGGAGRDRLTGGTGRDRFDYNALNEGTDIITDFERGSKGDNIDIRDLLTGFNARSSNVNSYVRLTGSGSQTTLWVNPDGVGTDFTSLVTLQNVAMTSSLLNEMVAQGNLVLV